MTVVDPVLEEGDGLEFIKVVRVQCPGGKVLALSHRKDQFYVERLLRAGASGYVLKHSTPEEILKGIHDVLSGQLHLPADISARILGSFVGRARAKPLGVDPLTDRELAVLQLLGAGKPTRQVAEALNLSHKTVESHRENIKRKLGLAGAAELVHFATTWAMQSSAPPTNGTRPQS